MPARLTFDHYEVLQRDDGSPVELGRGAMGITYKAFDTNLRVPVALKVINTRNLDGDLARERFIREARSAAALRHRNVASVFHLGMSGAAYFYAMEYIEGETVEELVRRSGPLPPVVATRIAVQVARAFNAAEQHGLVHRDIKPSNLMLLREDDEVCVKVIDFGLARKVSAELEDAEGPTPATTGFVGTPQYASPEQLSEKPIDIRSDIYSLGATLWHMLSGRPLFVGSIAEIISQQLYTPPPLDSLATLPAAAKGLLEQLLAKDPAGRPQSSNELRRMLEECAEQLAGGPAALAARAAIEEERLTITQNPAGAPTKGERHSQGAVLDDRFEVIQSLGDGALGTQLHVRDRAMDRELRLVLLHAGLSRKFQTADLLPQNAEGENAAEHPNVLALYGVDQAGGSPALLFEWTVGFTLLELLRSRRDLPAEEVLGLLQQMAAGVDAIHATGADRFIPSLQQTYIHFPTGMEEKGARLAEPISLWPEYVVKLNPVAQHATAPEADSWSGAQTIVGGGGSLQADSAESPQSSVRDLAWIVYELLGGSAPLGSGFTQSARYVPLANLTEAGNLQLQRALDPAQGFSTAAEFFLALRDIRELETARRDTRGAATVWRPTPSPLAPTPPVFEQATMLGQRTAVATPAEQKKGTGKWIAVALAGCVLMGGGAWWWSGAQQSKRQIVGNSTAASETESQSGTPLIADKSATDPATSKVAPATETEETTSIPEPDPEAKRTEALKAAVAEAEKLEREGDDVKAISDWLDIQKNFPHVETGRIRLELYLEELREKLERPKKDHADRLRPVLTEAVEAKVVSALVLLGDVEREHDAKAAFRWYTKAAEAGRPAAYTQLGLLYSNGAGTERNLEKAVECFEKASSKGDIAAKAALGECYLYGKGVARDEKRAIELLDTAAKRSNLRAMSRLGDCYARGIGVERDADEAFRLFSKAADRGYGEAIGNLGVLYINGEGTARDPEKAVELFERGAEGGDAYCMFLFARCLESGAGLPEKDMKAATAWYVKSAALGWRPAIDWCTKHKTPVPTAEKAPK